MNNIPRRFSKYMNGVSLQEHLEKIIDIRFSLMDKEIVEARRIMENRMAGFPAEFAKKSEMVLAGALLKEVKDRDLKELKELCDRKLSKEEYTQRHEQVADHIRRVEISVSNIQGRIAATGIIGVIVVVLVQVMLHIYWGK